MEGISDMQLTHVDADGVVDMVDVGDKIAGDRRARAGCTVRLDPAVAALVAEGAIAKGDVLATCRIAGILAAKQVPALIPLTHQVPLAHVGVDIDVDAPGGRIRIEATSRSVYATGVEIEALTAAAVAAVTLYDMVKAVDRGVVIDELRVLAKSGGRSGDVELDADGRLAPVPEPGA